MRILKLNMTSEQFAVVQTARHLVPDGFYKIDDTSEQSWLAEQLTAACQRRIDEVRAAAKATKP